MSEIIPSSPLPLDQNPAAVYVASLGGPQSTGGRTQAQALRAIASIMNTDPVNLNWGSLRYQHTAMIRSKLAQAYKPATANKMLSALRQTLKQAWLLGQMSIDDYMRAAKLEPVKGKTLPAGRYLTPEEVKAIMDACKSDDNQPAGIRDAAMIALMYIALLRREEVAKLSLNSYNSSTDELIIFGKRSKERVAFIQNGAREALRAWLAIRGNAPGALFVSVNKSGKITSFEHLTAQAVYNIISKRSRQAGIENNSPHNFRRTGASDYLAANVDAIIVSELGGWESVQTLKRYDRRPDEAKKKAANLLSVPF